jgi:hypothetical protein
MDWLFLALQESAFAHFVRNSVWLYPAANILHVLGVMGFFALVAAMDLSILRLLGPTPAKDIIARLRPFAIAGLILLAATGIVLLAPEAAPIAGNPAFQLKFAAIALALLNVILNTRAQANGRNGRMTAAASLALWLFVAAMGRSIAYL